MKNPILQICEKLRGYSCDTEYFEVVKVSKLEDGIYEVIVREVNENEGAEYESN